MPPAQPVNARNSNTKGRVSRIGLTRVPSEALTRGTLRPCLILVTRPGKLATVICDRETALLQKLLAFGLAAMSPTLLAADLGSNPDGRGIK